MKELTNSRIDRQNLLNNDLAVVEIQNKTNIEGIIFENNLYFTKSMVSSFYEVDDRTIERYTSEYKKELLVNGYELFKGQKLKTLIDAVNHGNDIYAGTISEKTSILGLYNFKALLNIGMLLTESEKAKQIRQLMLDIVIDFINSKAKIGTKYINQNDSVRETFYSEILNKIASYEYGFADCLRIEYEKNGKQLSIAEAAKVFNKFESSAHWIPLINDCRIKMSSRDLALREAFHYKLSEYIRPFECDEYKIFLFAL